MNKYLEYLIFTTQFIICAPFALLGWLITAPLHFIACFMMYEKGEPFFRKFHSYDD